MKSMLIAATVVGAAIAGIVLYSKSNSGNMNAKQMKYKARKIIGGEKRHQLAKS